METVLAHLRERLCWFCARQADAKQNMVHAVWKATPFDPPSRLVTLDALRKRIAGYWCFEARSDPAFQAFNKTEMHVELFIEDRSNAWIAGCVKEICDYATSVIGLAHLNLVTLERRVFWIFLPRWALCAASSFCWTPHGTLLFISFEPGKGLVEVLRDGTLVRELPLPFQARRVYFEGATLMVEPKAGSCCVAYRFDTFTPSSLDGKLTPNHFGWRKSLVRNTLARQVLFVCEGGVGVVRDDGDSRFMTLYLGPTRLWRMAIAQFDGWVYALHHRRHMGTPDFILSAFD
jgi:hypothetical protein